MLNVIMPLQLYCCYSLYCSHMWKSLTLLYIVTACHAIANPLWCEIY